ncbi:hypothetical protein TGDOM2_290030C, partial [Toxoplasma gondii GAB2-2007-GAL-DOM2]
VHTSPALQQQPHFHEEAAGHH